MQKSEFCEKDKNVLKNSKLAFAADATILLSMSRMHVNLSEPLFDSVYIFAL